MPFQLELKTLRANHDGYDADVWLPVLKRHTPYSFFTEEEARAFADRLAVSQRAEFRIVFVAEPDHRLVSA